SSSADDTVKLWEMATGQPLCTVNLYSSAEPNPVFSPDGKTLAVATSEKTYLYQVAGPGPKTTVGHDHGVVRAFAFMPGTSRGGDLACFTEEVANSAHAEVVRWDMRSGRCLGALTIDRPRPDTRVAPCLAPQLAGPALAFNRPDAVHLWEDEQ